MNRSLHETGAELAGESITQLEFPAIIKTLAGRTQTPYGRQRVLDLKPLQEPQEIVAALQEAEESRDLLEKTGPLPVGNGVDLKEQLAELHIDGLLLEPEFLREVRFAIEAAVACRTRLLASETTPRLTELAQQLTPLSELAQEIRRCIGPRDEILDNASFELGDLRRQLQRERGRVKSQLERLLGNDDLQGVFQETLITDRNGRYVVPVRADHSGRVKGFVHDVSASGQTLFLEPAAVLEGNNRISTLEREIVREIERILSRLTAEVRNNRQTLAANQQILAHLDLRQAIARFSRDTLAQVPELATEPLLDLRAARHPLLIMAEKESTGEPRAVIPCDLLLRPEQSALIISGPNTGGKTVALKTAGLLTLMLRAGLPIPCAPGSRLYPFAPVLADIGDEQSIEQSLSTFSGHLVRLRTILERAGHGALVLLDELGTGTDPNEGAALALAALDLLRQAGARMLATTHLHIIKGYAQLEQGVENAAVEFDAETLQPTYRLQYGIPGASHAFTIAERLGLPDQLLQKASHYLGHDQLSGQEIIERLQSLRVALEEELSVAGSLRQEAERERERNRQLREDLNSRRDAILAETRLQGSRLLADAEAKLRALFSEIKPERLKSNQRARLAGEVRGLRKDLPRTASKEDSGQEPQQVEVNERLFVPALGVDAVVVRCDARQVELDLGGKRIRQPLKALRQYHPRRFATQQVQPPRIRDRVERQVFRPRLVLVGKRVDEAQQLLERFLDEAMLHNQQQVEVVHGSGQGILRRAVRELLASRREVTSFHAADVSQGGDNITLVEMRH